jgi:arabinofuranosyltransferase
MPDKQLLINKGITALAGLATFLFVFVCLKNAWVSDDAYISFRSVEQFFAGNGLRWNIDERVQVFTSPLWFLFLLLGRVLSTDLFLVTVCMSFFCMLGVLWVARKNMDTALWMVFLVLASNSWAVMDFSSSGLENPLVFLLLGCFLSGYYRYLFHLEVGAFRYAMVALGLLAITRHDMATLVFFPSCYLAFIVWQRSGFRSLLVHTVPVWVPLLVWTMFSVIYYGMPFPNTAYAKMMHGVPRQELMDFGKLYLYVSFRFDSISSLIVLLLALRVIVFRERAFLFIFLGVLCNLFYVWYVGGDFMLGRFVSASVLVSAFALCLPFPEKKRHGIKLKATSFAIAILLLVFALMTSSPLKLRADSGFDIGKGQRHFSWNGILNERNFYFKTNSLWAWLNRDGSRPFPDHKWCLKGITASQSGKNASKFGGIGMYGYCAGKELLIIDNLALADPFLARLPKPPERDWRAGHFNRPLPAGYKVSRESGVNKLGEPHLRSLLDDVKLVVNGPLFSRERWQAIWRLNTGHHDDAGQYYLAGLNRPSGNNPEKQ